MKKSMSIILLGSAFLLSNNQNAEASYYDNTKAQPTQEITYKVFQGEYATSFSNQEEAQEFINKYMSQFDMYYNGFIVDNSNLGEQAKPSKPVEQTVPEKPTKPSKPETDQQPVQPSKPVQKPEVTVPDTNTNQPEQTPVIEKPVKQPQTQTDNSASAIEKAVLDLTNAERQKAGLNPLQMDEKLMKSARAKSADMATKNYFSHTSPTYGSPFDQMKSYGISYKAAAENIAMGQRSAEEVVKAWMESPGHKENILTPGFTHIGIGYDASGNYWTQQFIQK